MVGEDVTLDTDEAAKVAALWCQYADMVERHGAHQYVSIEELRQAVGDIYADYVDAKAGEYEQRHAAYSRVAAHARGHAEKLERSRAGIESVDAEGAARINSVETA